ncbi:adenosylcobinamide-GDP ribazoletransferase [Bengtsoniella intestinalis]|uniref:adenosylcobinamide-GDP ribazoletransferase n=1 Tax=Bengtsoniella intestinalis TaxID=3073143 RepID=UPI00391F06E5
MKSLCIAFAMYSKIPMPRVDWDKRPLSFALCYFPCVGLVIGAVLWGWITLSQWLGLGKPLFAAVALLLPIVLSGGIHLDGFCDTCDALSSHQSRERKLEILKDSHTGAFAIICCCLYLLSFFACWTEVDLVGRAPLILAVLPVLSRSLSGLFATTLPNARGSGLLATFTQPMDSVKARLVLGLEVAICMAVMVFLDVWLGLWAVVGCAVICVYYVALSHRKFGGITGDLAGFFLQLCEVGGLLFVILGQRLETLL